MSGFYPSSEVGRKDICRPSKRREFMLWSLTRSLLFRSTFHSRHQISEPLPLLPFTFVFWFGLGASDPPGELT